MAAISLLLYLSGESAGEGFGKVKRANRDVITLLMDLVGLKLPGVVPATLVLVGGFILRYAIVMAKA